MALFKAKAQRLLITASEVLTKKRKHINTHRNESLLRCYVQTSSPSLDLYKLFLMTKPYASRYQIQVQILTLNPL